MSLLSPSSRLPSFDGHRQLGSDASGDEQQQQENQQNQPPANKKAKTGPFRGLQESLHQQLQDLQQQRKPRASRSSGGGGGLPPRLPREDALNPSTTTAAQRIATHAAAAAAAAVATEIAKAGGPAVPQPPPQHPQQQRRLSRLDSTGSWRRLLSHRNSFLMDGGDGTSASGAGNNNNASSSSVGAGLTPSSSWVGRIAAADAAAGGANPADDASNPFLGGFQGRVGPVAEPLDPLMHARSHSYGLGDWLPPADITRDRDLDALAGALPGAAMAVDDVVATPLTGGIVAGRDHQF